MAPKTLAALFTTGTELHSVEGYVLPHLVDVNAGVHAIVRAVLVRSHDVVRRGQAVFTIELLSPDRGEARGPLVVEAPVAGLVTRSWARAGDVVAATWPILSIASAEDVLVVAGFARRDARRVQARGGATVHLVGADRTAYPARIVSVLDAGDGGPATAGRDAQPVRVVLAFPNAPAKVLWPGTPVRVEVSLLAACA